MDDKLYIIYLRAFYCEATDQACEAENDTSHGIREYAALALGAADAAVLNRENVTPIVRSKVNVIRGINDLLKE